MKPTIDMNVSPYDREPASAQPRPALVQLTHTPRQRWVPSHYNARTVNDDGRIILWNTLTGAVSVFAARHREEVLASLEVEGMTAPLGKVAEYLSKRGFLVREEANELHQFRYKFAQQHWRTDTLQLILLASEDCNFRCVYCYEKFKNGTMAPEVREGVKNLLLRRAPSLKSFTTSWFGGEPLYGWEAVEDLAPFFKETAARHGFPQAQHMTTNGYLLTEERATKLLDWGCRTYQITVDGLAEEHNCKRVGRDGSPTHAMILDNLRSMRARNDAFRIDIRVNFDQDNVPRLGTFLEALSEDFGGDPRFSLRFRAVGKWGGDHDDELNTCGIGEKRQVLRDLRSKAESVNMQYEGGIMNIAQLGSDVCYAARPFNFIVSATGKLMKCTVVLDDMDDNVVGQILPDGSMQLNEERMSKWVTPHFESDALCQNCHVLPTCQGANCPLPRLTQGRRSCSPTKSELKYEMRHTLERWDEKKRAVAAAT